MSKGDAQPTMDVTVTVTTLPEGHHVTLMLMKRAFHSVDTFTSVAAAKQAAAAVRQRLKIMPLEVI